jgi:SAM-dependent methyltransferase
MSNPGNESPEFFDGFYKAFENKFRGSRELIKERLGEYAPFWSVAFELQSPARAIDLGCGRGEWLELLTEAGFEAQGIDLSEAMLVDCRELGLDVRREDALTALRNLPTNSQSIVSGFHIAEHLAFGDLLLLVRESLRVLVPGGFLILETPNPDNIRVATNSFYLDPTHRNPLPSELLSFAAEYCGFGRVKVLRFRDGSLIEEGSSQFAVLLDSVSRDYAVIAQTSADEQTMSKANRAFEADHGVTFYQLAARHGQQDRAQSSARSEELGDLLRKWEEQRSEMGRMQQALDDTKSDFMTEVAHLGQEIADLKQRAAVANVEQQNQIDLLRHSTSWRVTAPLRWIVRAIRGS